MSEDDDIPEGEAGQRGRWGRRTGEGGRGGRGGEGGSPSGRGGKGGTGGQGGQGGWSDKAMMFLVAVLTLVFGFLYIRVSINQHEILESRYESCLGGLAIIEQYNAQQEELARILLLNPEIPGRPALARVYEMGALDVPDCGDDPSEN